MHSAGDIVEFCVDQPQKRLAKLWCHPRKDNKTVGMAFNSGIDLLSREDIHQGFFLGRTEVHNGSLCVGWVEEPAWGDVGVTGYDFSFYHLSCFAVGDVRDCHTLFPRPTSREMSLVCFVTKKGAHLDYPCNHHLLELLSVTIQKRERIITVLWALV